MIKKLFVSMMIIIQFFSINVFAVDERNHEDYELMIEEFYEAHIDSTAGTSIVISNNQGVIYKGNYGYYDYENKLPVDNDTVFEWGSVSKLLVWTSVMQLYEHNILDLETSIHQYLPADFIKATRISEDLTLLDLMNHRTGFQETEYPYEYTSEDQLTTLKEALIKTTPKQIYPVDTVTAYSNYGTALAAYIVEYMSDMDYSDYVKKYILEPLEMNDTAIKADLSDQIYVKEDRGDVQTYAFYNQERIALGQNIAYIDLYPVGSATGTIDDLQKFVQVFLDDTQYEKVFISKTTLDEMLSPSYFYTDSEIPRNYHGFWTMYYEHPIICHGGNTNGFSSNVMIDLENKLAYVVMTNVAGEMTYNFLLPSYIFGHNAITTQDNALSIENLYTSARTITKGQKSYLSLLMTSQVKKDNENYSWENIGFLRPIGGDHYLFNNTEHMNYILKAVISDGKIKLEGFTSDYIQTSLLKYWISKFLIWAMIVSILVTILEVFLLLFSKNYRNRRGVQLLVKMILLLELILFVFANNAFNYFISILFSSLLLITTITFLILSWKHIQKKRMNSLTTILYIGLDLLPLWTVIHFQLYMF